MITVRLFARLKEQAEAGTVEMDAAGQSLEAVYARLRLDHPALEADLARIRPALNQAFCAWEEKVADGDEVAFVPPVSGGLEPRFVLTSEVLDPRAVEAKVSHPACGAVCTFQGVVRNAGRGTQVTHLEYEGYPGMVEAQMEVIEKEILERWPEALVAMSHRVGRMQVGEVSVVVCVSHPHRREAIEACHWGIDRLKETVPIWKKEYAADGTYWIEGEDHRPARG